MTRAEQVTAPVAVHGEGPVWDVRTGRLKLVDIAADALLDLDPASGAVTGTTVPTGVTAIRPRRRGGWVAGTRSGFAHLRPDGQVVRTVEVLGDPAVRMNDGACDPWGRFWCGSMSVRADQGAGVLYRLTGQDEVARILDGLTIPNGLAWGPDLHRAFFVDSADRALDLLELDDAGDLRGRRRHVDLAEAPGVPDGIALDAEGGVWVAMYAGAQVRRYDADGLLSEIVDVDAVKPTACAFGGPDLTDLYVTSTTEDLDTDVHRTAGAVFCLTGAGVRGAAPHRFDDGRGGGPRDGADEA